MLNVHNLTLATLCSKEASRFTINGILVTPECTVVTDGHQLTIVDTPAIPAEEQMPLICGKPILRTWKPFILSADHAQELAKAIPKKSFMPVLCNAYLLERGEENVTFGIGLSEQDGTGRTLTFPILAGNFPDYYRALPKELPFSINLSALLLSDLTTFTHRMVRTKHRGGHIALKIKDNASAIQMDALTEDNQRVRAILMPMRSDDGFQDVKGMMVSEEVTGPVDYHTLPATEAVISGIAERILRDILVEMAVQRTNGANDFVNLQRIVEARLRGESPDGVPPLATQAVELESKVVN